MRSPSIRIPKRLLQWVPAAFWIIQLQFFAVYNIWAQHDATLIWRYYLSLDFRIFPLATQFYHWRMNPYSYQRFVAPPSVIAFGELALRAGHYGPQLMFLGDAVCVLISVWLMARHFGIARRRALILTVCAFSFYPVLFLLDRGNLDGIMLILFAGALLVRQPWLRGLLLGLSVNVKMYTLAAASVLALRKRWRSVAWITLFTVLFGLPYANLWPSFFHRQQSRWLEGELDNMSPASLAGPLMKNHIIHSLYPVLWLAVLLVAVWRLRRTTDTRALAFTAPWMSALPAQVWAYTGVMALPAYCAWMGEPENGTATPRDLLFAAGLSLAGTQQSALNGALASHMHTLHFFPAMNPLGIALLMVASLLPAPSLLPTAASEPAHMS